MPEKPDFVTNEHLEYLDDLRESGETNMFGAGPYIQAEFGLPENESRKVVSYWMETFSDRQKTIDKQS